jgi:predicted MFS family arabinose efflux permease
MTGTMKFLVMGTMPVGSFLGGVLAGSFGSRSTLWLIASVSALSVLAVAMTKLRKVSTAPHELRPETVVGLNPELA